MSVAEPHNEFEQNIRDWFYHDIIDPLVRQAAIDLAIRAGIETKEIMVQNGMSEPEADEVIRKAFEWRYEE